MHRKILLSLSGTGVIILLFGCAYFNTFYNAEQYFSQAEKSRLEKAGESLPRTAKDAYEKVIEKSEFVLNKYPDSKYRNRALLLIGKSRFHRQEYRQAEATFKQLYQDGGLEYRNESAFWLALCKWKSGKLQPAMDDLNRLLQEDLKDQFQSKIFISLAEIYLELDEGEDALSSLDKAADLTNNRAEKDQIYYRISELAFNQEDYQRALTSYRNVIKNSTSKKRIEEASLQTVRIYRLIGDHKTASNKIKAMLVDNTFKVIHGDLELELVKLYQIQGEYEQAMNRCETITTDYPRTKTSAEAYYLMGEQALFRDWDLEKALKHYGQVSREYRASPFSQTAQIHVKEINAYQSAVEQLQQKKTELETLTTVNDDTSSSDSLNIQPKDPQTIEVSIAKQLYTLGELESFHFNRIDDAVQHFLEIIKFYTGSDLISKALFTLSYLYNQIGDSTTAIVYQDRILDEYSKSDYADYIRNVRGIEATISTSSDLLKQAEKLWSTGQSRAILEYKTILFADSSSESSAISAYFIAYQYDVSMNNLDSTLKYYQWLHTYHPASDQAVTSRDRFEFLQSLLVNSHMDSLPDSTQVEY